MKADITFLTTPTSDTPGTALLLSFTGKNYLFGHVHEGFQRAGLQRGLNLLKTKDHFLTGKTEWTNIGGVLGLILSNADRIASSKKSKADDAKEKLARRTVWEQEEQERVKSGMKPRKVAMPALRPEEEEEDPTLTFRSGPNLLHTLAAARSFIFRQGMPVEVEEYDRHHRHPEQEDEPSPDFADDHIRAWALSMVPKRVNSSDDSTPPQSPKKRSLEDYMEGQKEGDGHTISDRSRTNRGQLTPEQAIRAGVVEDMFKSQWNSQKLIEVPLHSVSASASIFVRDPETTMIIPYTGPMPGGKNGFPDIPVLVREPWPGALVHQLPVTHTSDIAMSYIVKTYEQRGKFLPKEAIRLGVRPGPDFSTLTRGSSVKAKDGTIVTPDMVLEPAKAPSGFAIFDMPSLDYLAALRESPEIQNPGLMHGIKHAVWLLGPGIVDDPSFTQLLATLKDIKHTVSSHSVCTNRTTMTTAAMEHYRHRLVDPDRFSPLVLDQQASEMTDEFKPYLVARTGLRLQITPDVRIEDAHIEPDFAPHSDVESLPPNIEDSTRDLWQQLRSEGHSSATLQQGLTSPQTEVICLGTGSMVPSLDRNVSATLVRVHGGGTYLLDCGENTLGQMRRLFSPIELSEIFNDLKLIWISHLHADHHLGTIAVIKAWYNEVYGKRNMTGATPPRPTTEQEFVQCLKQSPKLCVASNFYMARWLAEYAMVEDFGYDHILPLETTNRTSSHPSIFGYFKCFGLELSSMSDTAQLVLKDSTGIDHIRYCKVKHCRDAYALTIRHHCGFKFSYSGDCRPSEVFSTVGKGSDLLIHEATFDDGMEAQAMMKNHSTISEAIRVGAAMDARRVILTHFSQRYAKVPTIEHLDKRSIKLEGAEEVAESEAVIMEAAPTSPTHMRTSEEGDLTASDDDLLSGKPKDLVDAEQHKGDAHNLNMTSSTCDNPEEVSAHDQSTMDVSSDANKPDSDMKVAFAFDYMRVKLEDIMTLEKFNPIMQRLYEQLEEVRIAQKDLRIAPKKEKKPAADSKPSQTSNATTERRQSSSILMTS